MSRPSNRDRILVAAIEVIGDEHGPTLTIEQVAARAGLTKAGVIYHFQTKEALLDAARAHGARVWEAELIREAGGTAEERTPRERVEAYVRVCATAASRAELSLMLAPAAGDELAAVVGRWVPSLADAAREPALMPFCLARLAADGLWISDTIEPLAAAERATLVEAILRGLPGDPAR